MIAAQASLVVMAIGQRRSWRLTDPVGSAPGACQKPVLFIPYEEENAP